MIIDIDLSNREIAVLSAIANKAGITPKQYAINIVRNFIKGQILGIYRKEFDKKSIEELVQIFGEIIP